jgi:ubiquinone/menaquinone biosynthesis C-methylase UbiE
MNEAGNSLTDELSDFKDCLRGRLLVYTRKAFHMLPAILKPEILDIGCGSGIPTIELARLSGGKVTGVDTDQTQLERLAKKAKRAGLADRVKAVNRSLLDLKFPERSYDIIWAEGSIAMAGFERGLREWRRFVRDNGFMVVHDDLGPLEAKLRTVSESGYRLIDYFVLDENVWWNEYYGPLGARLNELRTKHQGDQAALAKLSPDQREVDGFDPGRYRSVFLVMSKDPTTARF